MSKKILIADDDTSVIETLSSVLEDTGYKVIVAKDGIETLQQAFVGRPDLILLDIMMPASSGVTVYHKIKQSVVTESVPVIFITALTLPQVKESLPDVDPAIVFTKPWDPDELLAAIKKALGNN